MCFLKISDVRKNTLEAGMVVLDLPRGGMAIVACILDGEYLESSGFMLTKVFCNRLQL